MTPLDPLSEAICLEVPERLTPGLAWHEHIPFGMYLVAVLRPRIFVELGTHYGDSFCAFCQAVKTLGLDTRCYAIDTWAGDAQTGCYGAEVLADLRGHHDPRYGSFSRLVQSTFDEAAGYFPDRSIDLLHIDGYHAYEAVRHDVETWLPKTSPRAVVLLHDINVREREFGVWRLWQELAAQYPHFEFVHGHGLGVLAVGAEPPEPLRPLFAASDDEVLRIRRLFFELGHRLSLRVQLDQVQAERDQRTRLAAELQAAVDGVRGEIERVRDELRARDESLGRLQDHYRGEIERVRDELRARDEGLGRLQDHYRGEIERLRDELRARDESLGRLRDEHRGVAAQVAWMNAHPVWRVYLGTRLRLVPQGSRRERFWQVTRRKLGRLWTERPLLFGGQLGRFRAGRRSRDAVGKGLGDRGLERHPLRPDRMVVPPAEARTLAYRPTISVVTPVYDVAEAWLRKAIESVRGQVYEQWELCLVDDASRVPHIRPLLARYAVLDPRIRVASLPENRGIAAATNEGLRLATGEFVAFLDHDDELAPEALLTYVTVLNEHPDLDVLYSDEDKIDEAGQPSEPFYKPDWSPELLRGVMYVGHLLLVRRSLVEEAGGFDSTYDGVQDFELMLRLSERTDRIHHVRRVLYHWRRLPGSVAAAVDAKSGVGERQAVAVNAHLRRTGVPATAKPHAFLPHRAILEPAPRATPCPPVSIIIPTKDAPAYIGRCLDSLFSMTTYPDFEVIVVDNGTTDRAAKAILDKHPVTTVPFDEPFSFSRANNLGVALARGDYLVLLNNDTEVRDPEWLQTLVFHMELPNVGIVGPLLLYPDGSVQHAGVALGLRGTADHVMRGFSADSDGYAGSLCCTREVIAVTAACLMTSRRHYLAIGGLNEYYRTHYQDVDFCLRTRRAGRRILYTPRTHLIHHESASRGSFYDHLDRALLLDAWGELIAQGDPFHDPRVPGYFQ